MYFISYSCNFNISVKSDNKMNKIDFYWEGYQSKDNKIYEKAAMMIPVKTANHENLAMQFDLGIGKSVIYRNRFRKIIKDTDTALISKEQLFNNNLKKNDRLYLKTGEVVKDSFVLMDYNVDSDVKDIEKKRLSPYDAITIGSLGADFLNDNFIYNPLCIMI